MNLKPYLPYAVFGGGILISGIWFASKAFAKQESEKLTPDQWDGTRIIPLPMGTWRISSPYMRNRVSPVDGVVRDHNGIDLAAHEGTPIYSIVPGTVSKVSLDTGGANGMSVFVTGDDGYIWCYLHMSRIDIPQGKRVAQGEQLGLVGQTGRATGPHLHLQVYTSGYTTTVDPATLIDFNSVTALVSQASAAGKSALPYAIGSTVVGVILIGGVWYVTRGRQ